MSGIFIVSAMRTPIGEFMGSLSSVSPTNLGNHAAAATIEASGLDPTAIDSAFFGNVIQTEARDAYLARAIALGSGMPNSIHALTVNRLCGSGLQAVVSACQSIRSGDSKIALAGGAEAMSRAPFTLDSVRKGVKMGATTVTDMLLSVLEDPFGNGHMGVTAENIAERNGISRERQDTYAIESHRRAERARDRGHFSSQIVPIVVKGPRGTEIKLTHDEHIRDQVSKEELQNLRPAFKKNGSVTAGNASGINDGAAAIVLASEAAVNTMGLQPIARIVDWGLAGVPPEEMGMGPVPAVRRLLQKTGLKITDFDIIESNEAFAVQACAIADKLGFDKEKTNPNGGAVALGHPVGATGAIILTKLVHELMRTKNSTGLATMCIGGGQGIALGIERT